VSWTTLLFAGLGGGGLAGIVTSLIAGLMSRPKVKADAMAILTDSAIKQVNELQERTAEAEREATGARNELTQARQQVRLLTAEIDVVLTALRTCWAEILSPTADLDELRAMVRAQRSSGTTNGHRF
jgi:hypothetical protein